MPIDNLLTIVPARGGSRRLRRKNVLPINGIPLFLRAARLSPGRVVISTDDEEIASMARVRGYEVHRRTEVDDEQTITDVARLVVGDLAWEGDVLVVQPTVHPISSWELKAMVHYCRENRAPTVATWHMDHRHWSSTRNVGIDYELGVYFWPAGLAGYEPISHFELGDDHNFIDIDTPEDLLAAKYRPYNIFIDAARPGGWDGTGHWRRGEDVQLAMQHHNVYLGDTNPNVAWDIYVRDRGDSEPHDIVPHQIRGAKVVVFEDRGSGAPHADLVINSFLPPMNIPNERVGPKWAVIRPEFLSLPKYKVRDEVASVLIVLGGTDPRSLTEWVGKVVLEAGYFPVTHTGPGIAEAMFNADLFISGAGRAVQEAAYVGVPTIVIPNTLRESTHGHLGPHRGNIVLGQPASVTERKLAETVTNVAEDLILRQEMSKLARSFIDGRGLDRVVHEIEGLLI